MGRSRPRLHWCPAGLFAFLPLHAAGAYNNPDPSSARVHAFDYVVSSYIPTLSALMRAQTEFSAFSLKDSRALLVAEGASPGMAPLPSVKQESIVVRDILLKAQVHAHLPSTTNQTTKLAVTTRLSEASITHFACHGIQDTENPLNSGFCLRDGVLTVADLMRFNLPKAVFAFLSACETAQGDRDQPNQAIHLCAALLFCGFKSVIGTMW
jgi:CHAT domain-containing protein